MECAVVWLCYGITAFHDLGFHIELGYITVSRSDVPNPRKFVLSFLSPSNY